MSFTAKPVDLRATVDGAGNFHWTTRGGKRVSKEERLLAIVRTTADLIEDWEETLQFICTFIRAEDRPEEIYHVREEMARAADILREPIREEEC